MTMDDVLDEMKELRKILQQQEGELQQLRAILKPLLQQSNKEENHEEKTENHS